MKTLLHICCGPCSVSCIDALANLRKPPHANFRQIFDFAALEEHRNTQGGFRRLPLGTDIAGLWYNPNIYPLAEYEKRRDTAAAYARDIGLYLVVNDEYGLEYPNDSNRCGFCYDARMNTAAKHAKDGGFDNFTTTLLISPYQNHELIIKSANSAAKTHDIDFLYCDFRSLFREGQKKARERGMYMQKYCGCLLGIRN